MGKIFLVMSGTGIVTSKHLFPNIFVLRKLRVVNFTDIIKIPTMFIKVSFKDSKNVKKVEIMY